MATETLQHSIFCGEAVRVEIDINDANWRVSKVRVINDSPYPLVVIISKAGTPIMEQTALANQTTEWNVSGVQLGWQPDFLDSRDGQWYPDGIDMKDYTVSVHWGRGRAV